MTEQLLRLKTPEWELTIWCNDNRKRQDALLNTLQHRQEDFSHLQSELRFSHFIVVEEFSLGAEGSPLVGFLGEQKKLPLMPRFF